MKLAGYKMDMIRFAALVLLAATMSACQSARLGAFDNTNQPAPLEPAPTTQVKTTQLPPPANPTPSTTDFPEPPKVPETQEAAKKVEEEIKVATASSTPITREALVGAWKVSSGGGSCQMFMALTKWTGGYRAASRGCPGDAANISAWDVRDNKVVLSDSSGNQVATLVSQGGTSYAGTTSGGQTIRLSR